MAGSEFKSNLPRKLKFWAIHCSINAVPSYLIVVVCLGQFDNPIAHLSMLCAVVTFVVGYAIVTSLPGPLAREESLLSRSLKVGLVFRTICSIWTLLLVPTIFLIVYSPDFWCGLFATNVVKALYELLGYKPVLFSYFDAAETGTKNPGFMEIYLTTLLEGLVLSFTLFVISLIALVFLQTRDRKKYFLQANEPYRGDMQ